ncbi:MAG: nucleotidyltransferase domain-containing protein [archaeon]
MIQKYSGYRILQEFLNSPLRDFHMREISRRTKIAQPSVINYLNKLIEEGLVIKEKKGLYPTYRANREDNMFKNYKKFNLIREMDKSGLINFIDDSCHPDVIILFGSCSKGEDIESSDIDLFIQSKEKEINLSKHEKFFNKEINLFFEEDFSKLSKELKNNILNGIILRGYLKIF